MSKKIILGSSSITILKEVEWNLTDTDYEIIPANDIDDFRQSMKSQNPDLLIIDRDMQEGSGVSLCNEIKSNTAFAQLPLIILVKKTEEEGDEHVESLEKECKADKILGVPLESSKLLSTVQYFIAKQSAASDPLTRDLSKTAGPKAAEPAGAGAKYAAPEQPMPEMPSLDMGVPEAPVEAPPELFAGLENVLEGIEISPFEETPQETTAAGLDTAELAGAEAKHAVPEPLVPEQPPPEMPPLDAMVTEGQGVASQVGPGEEDAIFHEGESEHPALSAEEALEETIRVVEEAVKRGRYAQGQSAGVVSPQEPAKPEEKQKAAPPPEKAQAPPADAGGAEGLSQEQVQESVMQEFLKAVFPTGESGGKPIGGDGVPQAPPLKGEDVDTAGALQEESVHTKPQLDPQGMETRLKGMLQEQMHTLVEQSIPEMTKRLVQERMDQVISQSVPELTRNLIQEQITKLTEQSIPELTKRLVQEQMKQVISQSVPEVARSLIKEQIGKLTDQAVPELTKRLVQEQMKQMVTQAIPELTKNLIQEQMGRLTDQALPEMTKKLIQEKLANVIDEKNIAYMVFNQISQNVEKRIPDLAEKIIREEIEHMKQGYG